MNLAHAREELEELLGARRGGLGVAAGELWSSVMATRWPRVEVEVLTLQHPQILGRGRRRDVLELLEAGGLQANVRWLDGPGGEEGLAWLRAHPYRRAVTSYLPALEVHAGRGYRGLSVLGWTQLLARRWERGPVETSWVEESLQVEVQQEAVVGAHEVWAATACQLAQDAGLIPPGSVRQIPASGVHPAGLEWLRAEGVGLAADALH